MTLMDGK